jgi:gliding motility-associated lipoprotein GldH
MTGKTNRINLYLIVPVLILFLSCNRNTVFTDTVSIPGKEWTLDNVTVFKPEISDTISFNNISFNIRTGSSYPFRNIYLFVSTTSPEGKTITDTLQYMFADEKGKWYGKGLGDIHELRLPFKSGVYFPSKGIYTFRIRHGMRSENLKGVYDFGLRIEKTKMK